MDLLKVFDAETMMINRVRSFLGDDIPVGVSLPDKVVGDKGRRVDYTPAKHYAITIQSDGISTNTDTYTEEGIRVNVYGPAKTVVRGLITDIDARLQSRFFIMPGKAIQPLSGFMVMPSSQLGGFIGTAYYTVKANKR